MIDGGRCISNEEAYVGEFARYAKSLGCTCEFFDKYNEYNDKGYSSIGCFEGKDGIPPNRFWVDVKFNGDLVLKLRYNDYEVGYVRAKNRRFVVEFYNYEMPYSSGEKLMWRLKKLVNKTDEIPYTHHDCLQANLIPSIYEVDNPENYGVTTEFIKEKLRYLVGENLIIRKKRLINERKKKLKKDFL